MELTRLISEPEKMNKETLYDLRSVLALHPYYQTARLLLLQNLYILHDPSFDEELRRAAIYITDRKVIFQMIEAAHYRLRSEKKTNKNTAKKKAGDRTTVLIDDFLESIPKDAETEKKEKRRPTPADAAVDYVAYLMETESAEDSEASNDTPQMKGQSLIDSFLEDGGFNLNFKDKDYEGTAPGEEESVDEDELSLETLYAENVIGNGIIDDDARVQAKRTNEEPLDEEEVTRAEQEMEDDVTNDSSFTLTLSKIYIKQGRYEKALEIIQRLNLNYPKKNAYFADQIRFLQKLIINNKNKK